MKNNCIYTDGVNSQDSETIIRILWH